MDETHFDALTRSLTRPTRRGIVTAAHAAVFAALLGRDALDAALAKRKNKKQKRKKKRPPASAVVPPSSVPPPAGCPQGTRECAARGGCVPLTHCCTDSDCAPGGGGACQTDGTCACSAPWVACGEAVSVCALCCTDEHCFKGIDSTGHAACRDRACRCPNDDCGCPEAAEPLQVACGTGLSCFCYVDAATSTPRCGAATATCDADCVSKDPCPAGEFCGLCSWETAGSTCTTDCGA